MTVAKHTVAQPDTVGYVRANLQTPIEGPYIVASGYTSKVLLSHVCGVGSNITLKVVNDSESFITFRKGKPLGHAESVESYLKPREKFNINKYNSQEKGTHDLPNHLQEMYEKNSSDLSADEKVKFKQLRSEFLDVFSKDHFDLGCLSSGVEHKTQTYDELPIAETFRRTPLYFQKNGKKSIWTNVCYKGSLSHLFPNGQLLLYLSGKNQGAFDTASTTER